MRKRHAALLGFIAMVSAWGLGTFAPAQANWLALFCFTATFLLILYSLLFVSGACVRIESAVGQLSDRAVRDIAIETHAMQVLTKRFPECTIPTSRYSIRFANLHAIVDILDAKKPELVVELGSGFSTLCIASWMKQQGRGKLISIDHDENWSTLTRRYLAERKLTDFVDVRNAKLAGIESFGKLIRWYDLSRGDEDLAAIDLLIVDGPPSVEHVEGLTRLPAVEYFASRLSRDATVILDDVVRPQEQEILEHW